MVYEESTLVLIAIRSEHIKCVPISDAITAEAEVWCDRSITDSTCRQSSIRRVTGVTSNTVITLICIGNWEEKWSDKEIDEMRIIKKYIQVIQYLIL